MSALRFEDARILIIDDDPSIVRLLIRALQGVGYVRVQGFTDSTEVPAYLDENAPDLVVLDLHMPGLDGYAILRDVSHRLSEDSFLPVLVISGLNDNLSRLKAVEAGAKDFMAKPLDLKEFVLHVNSLLDTRFMSRRLNESRSLLEELVECRTAELQQAQAEFLHRLGRVAEVRDDATGEHTNRVGRLSALIAQGLLLSPGEVDLIRQAAPLHDLGKVAVADRILLKEGPLTERERVVMHGHALLGAELLGGGGSAVMQMAEAMALSHHERWDGQGYPHGLSGEDIPLVARIVSVADTFDALTHSRPYKQAWSVSAALAEIKRESGRQFDPQVVEALMRVQDGEKELLTTEFLPRPCVHQQARHRDGACHTRKQTGCER
jgi:putative two-component system response regulator